ncbi:hypothetical protein C825_002628 [Parabacteroides sp. ASF519]|nr:hypothetical protein C825_002628 [Parabacteroides sp. ASF519]
MQINKSQKKTRISCFCDKKHEIRVFLLTLFYMYIIYVFSIQYMLNADE